jgi:hypothetical protein
MNKRLNAPTFEAGFVSRPFRRHPFREAIEEAKKR